MNGVGLRRFAALGCSLSALIVLLSLTWAQAAQAVSFSAATPYGVGTAPAAVAVGDFDGDLKNDLAVANSASNNVSVLLGNGAGSFGTATNFAAGTGARSVVTGDFNNDAKLDLAVVNGSANNVSILLGTGTGSFGAATNFATGTGPRQVAKADFNADGNLDLAVVNATTANVSVLTGSGTGSFSAPTNYTVGTSPRGVAVGDFTGDAKADIAATNFNSGNVSVLINNGSGVFGAATNYSAGTNPFTAAVGDFDNDSKNDLAVINQGANNVSILLGNGAGSFGTATNFATGSSPAGIATGQFNNDGNLDLAISNATGNNVSILTGNGTGSFTGPANFAVGTTPAGLAVGLFNTGTQPDLAVANGVEGTVSVLLGRAQPALATTATASVTVGAAISDEATISGGNAPTGTIVFKAYGPDDATCANAPAFTSGAVTVSGNGTYASGNFTPATAGTYRWVASYSGDTDNTAATGACNDAGETSVVSQATPGIATTATASAAIGAAISDQATISGGHSPTGTITFKAFGPNDATCANAPAFTSSAVTVSGNGNYSSGNFTPATAGTYRWVASYSGDANNAAVSGACNDAGETSVVSQATPGLLTSATPSVAIEGAISDEATLSGGHSPTGTITFKAFGPNDATCANAPAFTSSPVAVSGNGTHASGNFTPTALGTYRWVASYSGDANNAAVSGACNDANETSVVTQATPALATSATASITIGGTIADQATLSGGASPTGTLVFKAFGPNDATCANAPAFTSSPVAVSGNGSYSSGNFTPTEPGTYRWIASYSGDANNAAVSGACNDTNETSEVSDLPTPTLTTQATAAVAFGGSISDEATLAGGNAPTGTITFKAFGPNDATCSNAPAFTSSPVAVSGNGTYASGSFTPATAGTYRWIATYSGDANNNGAAGACNDSGETSVVTKTTPSLATTASAGGTIGGSISDQATLSGGSSPTGTITFKAFGPNDATCANAPAFTSSPVAVSGNGNYSSGNFTPTTAGTYRWIASYSGDANNAALSGACNDPNESATVAKATPGLATAATATATIGGTIADQATISGGHSPTGTVVFKAFGPNDATCANAPAFTSSPVAVSGNGSYSSGNFTPTALGTYRWIATYSGDANNAAVSGACNDSGESSVVSQAAPSLSTTATANAAFGGAISDQATLAGGSSPTGTIVFRAYGPDDATCANAPAFTSSAVTVAGNGNYSSGSFTPTTAGTYRWIATYSGDANNAAVSGACNDAGETSVVAKTTPTLSTEATAKANFGDPLHDRATLAGGSSPTGTLTFKAFGPGDFFCEGSPAFTSSPVTVAGNGNYESPAFTPAIAGGYRWIASYSGDANNAAVSGACNDPNEKSTVANGTVQLSGAADASAVLGAAIVDRVTVAGFHPTGRLTFLAYGPDDAGCTGAPAFKGSTAVSAAGTYSSPAFTPAAAGTYRWAVAYTEDGSNEDAALGCNAPGQASVVSVPVAPDNEFQLGKTKADARNGSATLAVTVPGPGQLVLSGSKVKRTTKSVAGAATVKLKIQPSQKLRKQLKKKGKAKVSVTVTYTPNGGEARKKSRKVTLKMKK